MPISLEEQEVLCSNCYETIPMSIVDSHSAMCFKENRETTSRLTMRSQQEEDEENEYNSKLQELDERILKLINTFLKKLESQNFTDEMFHTKRDDRHEDDLFSPAGKRYANRTKGSTALAEERSLIHEVIQYAN